MRDLVIREGLRNMAGDAALRLRELLTEGKEIPYEVREAGNGSPLAEYVPQTSRFIRDHVAELVALDSFGTTCAALESAALAGVYLEEMGIPEPEDARRRGELAGVVFLCRLWQGSTDFTLDDRRLEDTMDELLELGEAREGEIEIAVPLRGFQMDAERLELADATIVRADVVDVPVEARAGDGMGSASWEPNFLAVARIDAVGDVEERDPAEPAVPETDLGLRAVGAFRRVVTTLQLFKAGGVALGPYAWLRSGGDRWRRIATGAGKPRAGGYRLADTELADLAGFSRGLAAENSPFRRMDSGQPGFPATLGRAVSRFQTGLERPVTLEALNDYLLTLRFLLEGGGPASLGMSMRVAALCAEPDDRTEVKATVDHALALERELWSGEPTMGSERRPPAEIAAEVEDLTRAILGDAACGHLGTELRTTADEILLGDGLQVGEGAPETRGETAEWNPGDPVEDIDNLGIGTLEEELEAAVAPPDEDPEWPTVGHEVLDHPVGPGREAEEPAGGDFEIEEATVVPEHGFVRAQNLIHEMDSPDAEFEWEEPTPSAERIEREPVLQDEPAEEPQGAEIRVLRPRPADPTPVDDLIADSDEHRREVHNRVAFLFPPPETTEWDVREVGYDRKRRAEVDDPTTHTHAS
jgi:hypothetical protein